MTHTKRLVRRRHRLHAIDPACHWCRVETVLIIGHCRQPPPNMATIDHLDDRFSKARGRHKNTERTVLACLACNHRRGQERQTALKDVQRAKSLLGHADKALRKGSLPAPAESS